MERARDERRAAIYVRISEDRGGGRLGVQRQAEDCRELAARLGWDVVETFEDNDISAYSGKPRPGYKRLLESLANGYANAVIAWHPDRLHRRPVELEGFMELVEAQGVAVATVQAGEMDLSTPSGRLVARQLGSFARYESEHKAERIRRALAQQRQMGNAHHGRRLYGYKGAVVVEDEAEHLKWAVEQLSHGAAWNAVARGLNERGAVTSTGRRWDRTTLRRVLRNPRLVGKLAHHGKVVGDGAWSPILSSTEWSLLQSRIGSVESGPGPSVRHLLSGILTCGVCGLGLSHMSAGRDKRGGARRPVYWCHPSPGGVRRGCGRITVSSEIVETAVTALVLEALGDVRPVSPTATDAVDALEVSLQELRQRQHEIASAVASGKLTVAVASQADGEIANNLAGVEERLAKLLTTHQVSRIREGDVVSHWGGLTIAERRTLLRDVMEQIVVKPVGRGWHRPVVDRLEVVWRR